MPVLVVLCIGETSKTPGIFSMCQLRGLSDDEGLPPTDRHSHAMDVMAWSLRVTSLSVMGVRNAGAHRGLVAAARAWTGSCGGVVNPSLRRTAMPVVPVRDG